jgi:hypothetical protein
MNRFEGWDSWGKIKKFLLCLKKFLEFFQFLN